MIRGAETVEVTFKATPKAAYGDEVTGSLKVKADIEFYVQGVAHLDRFDEIEVQKDSSERLFPKEWEFVKYTAFTAANEDFFNLEIIKEHKSTFEWDYSTFEEEIYEDDDSYDILRDAQS